MNILTERGSKKILSNDKLFYATVGRTFLASDTEEKHPIPYINIWLNEEGDNNDNLISLYFNEKRPQNEVLIHGNTSNHQHHRISVARLFQLATFVKDLQNYFEVEQVKNPNILHELRNY